MFKVIRSNRSELEIWQTFDLYRENLKTLLCFWKSVSLNLMAVF